MKWNDIKCGPPKRGGVYLATDGEDIQICGYWKHMKPEWADIDTDRVMTPTHWMELPGKPKITEGIG